MRICEFLLFFAAAHARTVTIRNDIPRKDIDGNYLDAYNGKIIEHNGTYFLYVSMYKCMKS